MFNKIVIDPTGFYKDKCGEFLRTIDRDMPTNEWCVVVGGEIPLWIHFSPDAEEPLSEVFARNYPFGEYKITDGTMDERGIYQYPGDPPSHPTCAIHRNNEICYVYEHAFFGVVNKESHDWYMVRMD